MTEAKKCQVCHKIAKFILCAMVLLLSIPGTTLLTLASVIVWFYGEDLLAGEAMKRFAFIQKFLPAVFLKD